MSQMLSLWVWHMAQWPWVPVVMLTFVRAAFPLLPSGVLCQHAPPLIFNHPLFYLAGEALLLNFRLIDVVLKGSCRDSRNGIARGRDVLYRHVFRVHSYLKNHHAVNFYVIHLILGSASRA